MSKINLTEQSFDAESCFRANMFGIFRHGLKITNNFSSRCWCFFCRFESLSFCADSYITTPPKGDG